MNASSLQSGGAAVPVFAAPYAPADETLAPALLRAAGRAAEADARIDARARHLVESIRARAGGLGGIEDFLHAYSLSTKEGLALMVLAEALLRVPDAATADALIEDKLAAGDWSQAEGSGLLVSASAWTLGLTARVIQPGETPDGIVDTIVKRLGLPTVRLATRQAMRLLGSHFVLGQTIEEALDRAGSHRELRYSFDMLGEGARTAADAAHYFDAYSHAIESIGARAGNAAMPARPGISVKLSALHPRYEAVSRQRVLTELTPRVLELSRAAKRRDLNLTIDAEEADRLELSLELIGKVVADPSLSGWDGFGLAVQAYQKRAAAVIDWFESVAQALNRRMTVRLVKGAYWDTEIKRAQERGLADYPVFTRKPMTDLNYMACVRRLVDARPQLYPQFATHNALTVASIIEDAGGRVEDFEFQRLHGMGEALYESLLSDMPQAGCRVYAPVGSHRDLLAYLVRRLLENGANSSFVAVAADPNVPIDEILRRPASFIGDAAHARHPHIPLPRDLYKPARLNSAGIEFGDRAALHALVREVGREAPNGLPAVPPGDPAAAIEAAANGFPEWSATALERRAEILDRAAELLEASRGKLIALIQAEGGKTLDDALSEAREAVDYCRYYAAEARRTLKPTPMPGPTGESNELRYRGRGVFVCISPWNFPLAIFLGQVTAALAAGNTVAAKPAEQTPLIGAEAFRLLHQAGVPADALRLVQGDGKVGAALVADPRVAGVAFTGSTAVGHAVNRSLAAKDGPIVPLIAETGGINAMIVDATALPEQVTDDVVMSAFRSAGQRCSALRLLCVQEDVADRIIAMIAGAATELALGDPRDPAIHAGPVIDDDAKERLDRWIAKHAEAGRVIFRWDSGHALPAGRFVGPTMIGLDRASDLQEEVFGPVLHVVRWRAAALDALLGDIASNGTGLTLGIHTRIDAVAEKIAARLRNGNVYVNRSMIGAVVGTQPFGGAGLSGTGPKAGGPNYLRRFASEQTVTVNTAAAGGNATLLSERE
jgi:RHH-type proline utilization regulon transcriptional repressor/proline dehydrogenase/delta 1-pyrroline-5-carboxylate dehydrogenase